MNLSKFGEKFTKDAGILKLMDDLGNALSVNKDILMLGGGNPGRIPAVEEIFRKQLLQIVKNKNAWHKLIGIYDPPKGNVETISSLVSFFNNNFGWNLKNDNICLTNGTQTAFFMLFNILAGEYKDKVMDSELVFEHNVKLTGLEPGVTYHYMVESMDECGNCVVSRDCNFRTLQHSSRAFGISE